MTSNPKGMLYSFDIQYFEPALHDFLIVPIILDLPQDSIQDVRHNLFIVDLVNHPFIKSGLTKMPGHKPVLVDNIQSYNSIVPSTAVKIPCKYKSLPGDSEFKTFVFNVYFVYPEGYVPSSFQLEFTCGRLYDAYEYVFQSRVYMLSPRIPDAQCKITEGFYFLCDLFDSCELIEVTRRMTDGFIVDSISENGSISSISLNQTHIGRLRSLRLNDQLLTMIGFCFVNSRNIYGLTGVNYFQGVISRNGTAEFEVFIKRDTVGYSLIVYDSSATNNCRLLKCFYLHELQELMQKEYHTSVKLAQSQLISICQYFNNTVRMANIISHVHSVISQYYSQNYSSNPTREQIISYVADFFGITPQDAQSIMVLMHC